MKSSYFLIFLLLLTFAAVWVVFAPFLSVFILAMVLGVIFRPLHELMVRYVKIRGLAAFLSTLIVLLIILGPVALIITRIFQEGQGLIAAIQNHSDNFRAPLSTIQASLQSYLPYFNLDLMSYVESGLQWVVANAASVFSNVAQTLTNVFLSMFGLYYWFKDGDVLETLVLKLSPLSAADNKKILARLSDSIRSVIRGTMIIVIIQGIVAGFGFWMFGVPNPVLWGTFAAVSALIPGVGTAPVVVPAIIYLFMSGQTLPAIGMLIWGSFAVGLIDNFLGPKLVSRGSGVHPFFILIAVLGGLQLFGPVGFLAGPLLASLFFVLLDIYSLSLNQS
jgi:predicted PurR-regulated permease PerM